MRRARRCWTGRDSIWVAPYRSSWSRRGRMRPQSSRRTQPSGTLVLRMGVYEIDIAQHRLFVDKAPVALTQKEFDLAVYVFQNPAKLFTRDHLLSKIWGLDADIDTRTVDTHVSRLRK